MLSSKMTMKKSYGLQNFDDQTLKGVVDKIITPYYYLSSTQAILC